MKCVYCQREVEEVGKCGVCQNCCESMIVVCSEWKECRIGQKVARKIVFRHQKCLVPGPIPGERREKP